MVGPTRVLWKVLRDTDGERFVVGMKATIFTGEFAGSKKEIQWAGFHSTIKILLHAIIYPLAIELFALRNVHHAPVNKIYLRVIEYGPRKIELGVAKKFSITIMRLPRWKRNDCQKVKR